MGQPERIRSLPYHEIGGITTLFLRGTESSEVRCPETLIYGVRLLNVLFSCSDILNK